MSLFQKNSKILQLLGADPLCNVHFNLASLIKSWLRNWGQTSRQMAKEFFLENQDQDLKIFGHILYAVL